MCKTYILACEQCRKQVERHPLEDDPLHLRNDKSLWDVWQIDYIGPFRKSSDKNFVLVGVEIISGLVQVEVFKRATGDNTVKALQEWFGTFPKPQEIQSDSGTHFTAKVVQDWAKDEGIKLIFHTPYYPQANGIVERTNGLLKRLLKLQETGWDLRLWKAVKGINDRWGVNRCPKITAFCPKAPNIIHVLRGTNDPKNPGHYPGQPVLVDLPTVGEVPLVLKPPLNEKAWVATNTMGKELRISTNWIVPSF
ncbi:hypothetical protein TURU_007906 [Turdus rufiventris]|nr:hypothetical protein TURU_007906 [Turdus rufiventris]